MNYAIVNGKAIIPQGLTSIGDWAFYGCTGLTDVTKAEIRAINPYAI